MDAHNMKKATATGKRKAEDPAEEAVDVGAPPTPNQQPPYAPQYGVGDDVAAAAATSTKKKAAAAAKPTDSAKVQARLEANRKAARESRRRKKVLVEELQRSVIFFSRANGQLKQKNDELERMFIHAQAQIAARNGIVTTERVQDEQKGQGGGENNTDEQRSKTEGDGEGGAVKTANVDGDDAAETNEEDDVEGTLVQQQQQNDAQQQQQQPQQEITNISFPGMVQQPTPFTAVPGAPAMDPNSMMMYMMMSGISPMMAANPMMALQMFNQFNAAGAMVGGGLPNQNQQQQTQGGNAAAAPPAASFPMPLGMGNVIMPTPGGAFNPFLGVGQQQGAFGGFQAAPAEGDSSSAAAAVARNVAPVAAEEHVV